MNKLNKILLGLGLLGLVLIGSPIAMGATYQTPEVRALFETTLASRISDVATSLTLTSATDKDGSLLASSTYGIIIDEGAANEELILADCAGTACTNLTRGISVRTGTSTVASLREEHRRGASVKITDAPALMFLINVFKGFQNIENPLKYSSGVATTTLGLDDQNVASVGYVNGVSFGSVPAASETASGFVELATGIEAASSTSSGSAARLVIPASLATSTYNAATAGRKVVVTQPNGKIDSNFFDIGASEVVPVTNVYEYVGQIANDGGDTTTQYDITNPAGTTFRYTWDGTGSDPGITALTVPIGTVLAINVPSFSSGNNGMFVVTGSGTDYFEVTNASGVAEINKTIGVNGYISVGATWTKPAGLKYAVVEVQGGGGGGGGNTTGDGAASGGGGGAYSKKIYEAADLSATESLFVGRGGGGGSGTGQNGSFGGDSRFKSIIANGGDYGEQSAAGADTVTATGGDINIPGQGSNEVQNVPATETMGTAGGSSFLGVGGRGRIDAGGEAGYGYGGGGAGGSSSDSGADAAGGSGAPGVIIITEYFSIF